MVAVDGKAKERRGTHIRRKERIGAANAGGRGVPGGEPPEGTGCLP